MITQAQQQAQNLIITSKEIIKDMQAGDANITAFQTLITNLSQGNAFMGVKTTLASVTLTAADIAQAKAFGH